MMRGVHVGLTYYLDLFRIVFDDVLNGLVSHGFARRMISSR
jgi:hypothetical protein